jgi:hypothetical protein
LSTLRADPHETTNESATNNVKSSDIFKQKYFATGINNEELLHVSTLIVDSIDGIASSRLFSDAKTLRT